MDHCLRAFTSEEKLEEWYHCAHCKGKKPATKKLQIWKLPPILVRSLPMKFISQSLTCCLMGFSDHPLETFQFRQQQMGEIPEGRQLSVQEFRSNAISRIRSAGNDSASP